MPPRKRGKGNGRRAKAKEEARRAEDAERREREAEEKLREDDARYKRWRSELNKRSAFYEPCLLVTCILIPLYIMYACGVWQGVAVAATAFLGTLGVQEIFYVFEQRESREQNRQLQCLIRNLSPLSETTTTKGCGHGCPILSAGDRCGMYLKAFLVELDAEMGERRSSFWDDDAGIKNALNCALDIASTSDIAALPLDKRRVSECLISVGAELILQERGEDNFDMAHDVAVAYLAINGTTLNEARTMLRGRDNRQSIVEFYFDRVSSCCSCLKKCHEYHERLRLEQNKRLREIFCYLQVDMEGRCRHGCPKGCPNLGEGWSKIFAELSNALIRVYYGPRNGLSLSRANEAFETLPRDETLTKCLISVGTSLLLEGGTFFEMIARYIAVALLITSDDGGLDNPENARKFRDLEENGSAETTRFFLKQINCDCKCILRDKYKALKKQHPPSGKCCHCNVRRERRELMLCDRCRCMQYCSTACQEAHWSSAHEAACAEYQSFRMAQAQVKTASAG